MVGFFLLNVLRPSEKDAGTQEREELGKHRLNCDLLDFGMDYDFAKEPSVSNPSLPLIL
jgi:hypothetical protein